MAIEVFALESGHGHPVVLVSGLGGQASFWKPVMERLEQSHHVITFDHPGVGGSSLSGRPTIPGIVEAVLHVLEQKGIERAHFVGHSTGSLVVQTLALDFPERVESIVLSSGWARPDKRFEDFFAYRKLVLNRLGGTAYTALTRLAAYPSEWYGENFATEEALDFDAPSPVDVDMVLARIDMLLSYNRLDELHRISAKTLVVGAEDDYVIPYHHSRELARRIPGAQLVELSGGHFSPVTRTDDFVSLLRNFWESLA
ncbi:alpha/beta hydrolase [Pseudomonas sp. LFM046]|uniref:alpha/beta fold hydrolase n=1 Tax=Pseudomonas sp. LFM046 TaxID=1608357 RepID=UPI0005CFE80A|nr:alpha/beta hydrolase [Pseudomonas sp. LFM046]